MVFQSKATIKGALTLAFISIGISAISIFGNNYYRSPVPEGYGLQRSGAAVYAQMCARCHGLDGRATTAKGRAVGATDLTSTDWSPDTARDTRIVRGGKEEMPAFKAKLKAAEIDAVVSYIRRFKR